MTIDRTTLLRRAAGVSGRTLDVAVVGAGVFGVWTAERLKRAGADVLLVDAYGVAHARASSAGESRITRFSYGGDALYSEMARESLAAWRELSDRAATPLFYRTGVLWFSPKDDAYMAKSLDYLRRTKTLHREYDAEGLRAALPQMRFDDGEAGFLEEETGALIAGRAVQTVAALCGVPLLIATCGAPQRKAGVYLLPQGFRAQALVYACGPWLPKIFPDPLAGRIVATRQEVLHFGPASGDNRFAPGKLPVWADFNGGRMVYGCPDLEGQGFKLAFDEHGPEIDPDTLQRRVSDNGVAAARAYLRRRFPDLADAPLVHARVCQYENSCNGDFLIDRHPDYENVWLVGAGSGHGFKHGPAVGRIVSEHVLNPARSVEPRFSLATKEAARRRSVY